ncbi:MAG: hypothetical protein V1917_01640 [Candidatus Gottesmanbacteria bacterium]
MGCIFIISLFSAVLPLFGRSYIPTHDGEYHIIRIVEFAKMMQQGYLFPRWAPDLNSGYGIPIFQYHYPFPNYVGVAISGVLHDAVRSFQMAQGFGYVFAVIALFGWLSVLFGFIPAVVGATIGAYVPYWFVDLYVRGSIGEVWATAFLFCILYVSEKKKHFLVGLFYGLLILSHNVLAMVYTPVLIGYFLIRNRKSLWALLVGLGIASYFWIPAVFEQRFVMGLNTVNFREHFVKMYELLIPSWGTEFSGSSMMGNKISFQIGVIPFIVLFGSLIALVREKEKRMKVLLWYFIAVFVMAIFIMLPWSQRLWELIVPIQYIQYPWRLLSLGIPAVAIAGAYWVSRMKRPLVGILLMVLAMLFSYSYTRPVQYASRNEAYYTSRSNFMDGTSSMGNSFSTIWTGWKETHPSSALSIQNGAITAYITTKYLEKTFKVLMTDRGTITVNTVYFPGWKAFVDAKETPITYTPDGIIRIAVSKGSHVVRIVFVDTVPRIIGNVISVMSVLGVFVWGLLPYIMERRRHNRKVGKKNK